MSDATATHAVRYAQSVLDWCGEEGVDDGLISTLAGAAGQFASLLTYGERIRWQWGEARAQVPIIDRRMAALFLAPPSARARNEATFAPRLRENGVIDLLGDPLTLRLAMMPGRPLILTAAGRPLRLWKSLFEVSAPDTQVCFVDIEQSDPLLPASAAWARCAELGDWLGLVNHLSAWRSLKPLVTCGPGPTPAPEGWSQAFIGVNGQRVSDPAGACLRIVAPPGMALDLEQ